MTHGNALEPALPTRRTVLVVDDTDVTRQRLRRILSNDGYDVVEASNGRRALLLLASPRPVALIVLDLVMPQMSGWEFRQTQLTTPGLADIPTVLMTATPLTGHERFVLRAQGGRRQAIRRHRCHPSARTDVPEPKRCRRRSGHRVVALVERWPGDVHQSRARARGRSVDRRGMDAHPGHRV